MAFLLNLEEKILASKNITLQEAEKLLELTSQDERLSLFRLANKVREVFRGRIIDLCSLTNAKSGNCSQDCSFCAQSSRYNTNSSAYPLISVNEMVSRAEAAYNRGANRFCIVTSGCSVSNDDFSLICRAIKAIKSRFPALKMDASLGALSKGQARELKQAGLDRYNHNIETSEDFFSSICSTHSFKDRLATISVVRQAGIELCCGGIIGLGESPRHRLAMAFYIRELDVDCVPLNFLNPIAGTPLEAITMPQPLELLQWIAIFRLILPRKQIRICGGRQKNLRQLQPLIFYAGADAIIFGDYLTTAGSQPQEDLQMIADAGLQVSTLS